MPPYKAVTSKAQARKMFAMVADGDMTMDEARGKVRAAKGKRLPERKSARSGRRR